MSLQNAIIGASFSIALASSIFTVCALVKVGEVEESLKESQQAKAIHQGEAKVKALTTIRVIATYSWYARQNGEPLSQVVTNCELLIK